jgi:hypothetical protein
MISWWWFVKPSLIPRRIELFEFILHFVSFLLSSTMIFMTVVTILFFILVIIAVYTAIKLIILNLTAHSIPGIPNLKKSSIVSSIFGLGWEHFTDFPRLLRNIEELGNTYQFQYMGRQIVVLNGIINSQVFEIFNFYLLFQMRALHAKHFLTLSERDIFIARLQQRQRIYLI